MNQSPFWIEAKGAFHLQKIIGCDKNSIYEHYSS